MGLIDFLFLSEYTDGKPLHKGRYKLSAGLPPAEYKCKIYNEREIKMSENKFSSKEVIARCVPMSRLQSVIGGKWKILILWYVSFYKVQRFGELMRRLDGITQSTLTKQLRELENDGFLHREIYREIPPKVEYSLTELGESFLPVLKAMMAWSEAYLCPDYENPYK